VTLYMSLHNDPLYFLSSARMHWYLSLSTMTSLSSSNIQAELSTGASFSFITSSGSEPFAGRGSPILSSSSLPCKMSTLKPSTFPLPFLLHLAASIDDSSFFADALPSPLTGLSGLRICFLSCSNEAESLGSVIINFA